MRSRVEWLLRGALLAALAFAIVVTVRILRERPTDYAKGGPAAMWEALRRWSTVEAPARVHAVFDSVPTSDVRDWLAALNAVGTKVSWEGDSLRPTGIGVEPVVDPARPLRVWIAAPEGSRLAISDSLGLIDTVVTQGGGALITIKDVSGPVRSSLGGTIATALPRDSLDLKPVLVLGIASWEAKFVMASLEELGWKVDARFGLAPNEDVIQGAARLNIDTSRYAAVIALDTSAAKHAARIAEYVRRGGGLIVSGEAAALPVFASLVPGTTDPPRPESPFEGDSSRPRRALALATLANLKRDAVVIDVMDDNIAIAARRVGHGRVLQVGYLNTWRWRMGGLDEDPVRAYRAWWSAMVSSVAYAPAVRVVREGASNPAPVASLIGTLGAPSPRTTPRADPFADPRLLTGLFALILGALLLETASRRFRGQP